MKTVATDFHTLSIAERIQLVEDIRDSIAAGAPDSVGLTTAQHEEIRRRIAAHEADPSSAVPWGVVRTDLFDHSH